jgi:hypothetical protein
VLPADDTALREITEAVRIAEQSGDDYALNLIRFAHGFDLVHGGAPDRASGLEVLGQVRDNALRQRFSLTVVPVASAVIAWEEARRSDRGAALPPPPGRRARVVRQRPIRLVRPRHEVLGGGIAGRRRRDGYAGGAGRN